MNSFLHEGNDLYPTVIFEPDNGYFEINGNSLMEDAENFYANLLDKLEGYSLCPKSKTQFIFNFNYFNITSSKRLLFILYKLSEIKNSGNTVKISWFYDKRDENMLEAGKDFEFMIDIPFDFNQFEKEKKIGVLV